MSNKMPKRKRSEGLANWSAFGIENELDLSVDNQKRQTVEELKAIISLDEKQQPIDLDINHMTSDNQMSTNECQLKNITEQTVITTDTSGQTNGQKLSPNLEDNHLKLRRKSNRISKPIQRSLESTTTTNSPNSSLKKIDKTVNKNNLTQNVSNCDSDKTVVNKVAKSDDSNQKNSGSKGGKSLRKLQMWTNEDTKCFFEAISEHGKDFPKVQSYIAQRCEKKGIPQDMIKNYEQVRHYYYRMWHKIANSLIINEVVDKNIQEIYGLVNYGEIWKKFGTKFDNKLENRLQQLVNFGHTTFKVKGKSVRVKTPVCKALKKIHKINVSENTKTNNTQNLLNLPKEVCIELHPANNESWLRVHSLSQNPRVRTKLSLQKRLSNLVEYLEKRWNCLRIKDSECRTLLGTSLPNDCQTDNKCLRVRPHSSGDLNNVSLSKSLFNSQMDLSLTAYLKTLYNDELKVSSKKSKSNKSKDKELNTDPNRSETNMKSPNSEQNSGEKEDNCDKNVKNDNQLNKSFESEGKSDEDEPIAEAERSLTLLRMLEKMNEMNEEIHATDEEDDKEDEDQNKDEEEEREDLPSPETNAIISLPEPPANATLAQWLSGTDADNDNNDVEEDNEEKKTSNTIGSNDKQLFQLSAERARKGWSLKECGSMTIGELYLLFRCPKKILLEYVWEPIVNNVENSVANNEQSVVTSITSTDDINSKKEEKKNISDSNTDNRSDLLYKLLMTANLSLQSLKRSSNSSNTQTQKKKRIKPTPAPLPSQVMITTPMDISSQLLSNVISNTIFNDNSNDGSNKPENSVKKVVNITDNEPKTVHNFIVPKSPAPKAVNKSKSRNICGDPALIQEALRQLQSNKYTRRQRRPTPKPVFGQNKPLLPRGSPPNIVTSTPTATVSPQQPIYVIPSAHPLHINAMTTVTSNASVLSQSLPVVNMTTINANELRQSIKTHRNSDSFDVIIPQKEDKHSNAVTQSSVVEKFINKIHSSNIPVIQIEPISSVSVPIISSSMSSTQTLKQTLDSYSVSKSTSLLDSKTISMFETKRTEEKNHLNINENKSGTEKSTSITSFNSNINVLDKNNEVISNSTEDSTEKLMSNPHISSLLEISLPEPPFSENSCSSLTETFSIEKRPFERLNLPNISQNSVSDNTLHKHSLNTDPTLPTSVSQSSSLASPPIERHKLTPSVLPPEQQWLNGESCDLSLGTLLNTCESPVKTVTVRDNHSLTNDVDTNMSCLVTDNSVDLMAKFADLVGHVVDTNSKST